MKQTLLGLSMLCALGLGALMFSQCQKTEEQQASGTLAANNATQNQVVDRGVAPNLGCTSCTNLEWKISCPQTCEGENFDQVLVKLVAKKWDPWASCCENTEEVWNLQGIDIRYRYKWMDMSLDPVISPMYGVCDPSFTAFFSAEGYLKDASGNLTLRLPGKVYIQTRRKGDTSNQTLRTHEILLNQDVIGCTPVSSSSPGIQTIVPVFITNGCVVTSQVEIPETSMDCSLDGGGSGG